MIPMPSVPWTEAKLIVGAHSRLSRKEMEKFPRDPTGFADLQKSRREAGAFNALRKSNGYVSYADFYLVEDSTGGWHCIGIEMDPDVEGFPTFHHHVSDRLDGTYRRVEPVASGFLLPDGDNVSLLMCSPSVAWKDEQTALMFYGHQITRIGKDGLPEYDASMRVLQSNDGRLESWSPRYDAAFQGQNVVFRENCCRDPEILWVEERKLYFMYYCTGDGWKNEEECALRVRTSPDLSKWSEAKTLMVPPPGYRAVESIFVLKKDGLYYLWVCGFDWGRMSLYISDDPMDFGHPVNNRIMEQSGHTPEIVYTGGQYWMACAGIAFEFGHAWGVYDLLGTYIQPMKWVEADAAALKKVRRR